MTTTDTTALDLDAIRPATDLLITQLREAVGEIKGHTHPSSGEDFYCLNLTSWLGERMGPVLRRLADEQAEARSWKDRHAALADEFTAEVDRLRAQRSTTAPAAGTDINLHTWCADTAASYRYYEEQELGADPGGVDRDRGLVEWVVMALGNPEQPGAREVLAVLAARHGLELTSTQAEAVAR